MGVPAPQRPSAGLPAQAWASEGAGVPRASTGILEPARGLSGSAPKALHSMQTPSAITVTASDGNALLPQSCSNLDVPASQRLPKPLPASGRSAQGPVPSVASTGILARFSGMYGHGLPLAKTALPPLKPCHGRTASSKTSGLPSKTLRRSTADAWALAFYWRVLPRPRFCQVLPSGSGSGLFPARARAKGRVPKLPIPARVRVRA